MRLETLHAEGSYEVEKDSLQFIIFLVMVIFCSWLRFFLTHIQKENLVINLQQKIYMTVLKFKICEISLWKAAAANNNGN